MTTSTTPAATSPGTVPVTDSQPGDRARTFLVAAALALAAGTLAVLLVTTPWGERNELGYDAVEPIRDAAWTGMLVDGFAFAVLGLTLGLTACRLARERGRIAATIGAILTTGGGVLFAMGSFGFATTAWYATSDGISAESGRALLTFVEDNPAHFYGVTGAGFLAFTVGTLVVVAALIRARAVPVVAAAAVVVLTLAQFGPVPARVLDVLQIVLMVCWVGLAGVLVSRSFRP